jgi:hypothetical protein
MPTTSCHGYQQGSNVQLVANFTVFSVDANAGRVENIAAASPEEVSALVQAKYPGAVTSAVPAEATEGCNRQKLLWVWMGMLEQAQQMP